MRSARLLSLPLCIILCVCVCLLTENPLQYCQSRDLSLPLPFHFTVRNRRRRHVLWRPQLQVLGQTQGRLLVVVMTIHEKQGPQCWTAHISNSNCMVTSSVSAPRIGLDGSSSTRRPSSCDMLRGDIDRDGQIVSFLQVRMI